jgi:hypothetical protein
MRAAEAAGPWRGPPPAAWRCAVVLRRRWTLSRAGAQLAVCVSTGGLPLLGLTHGCLRELPGDAHALWQRVAGVLRAMPVADSVWVSGSVGHL